MGKGVSKIINQRAVINWDDLTKLCQMQCTAEEAASFLGVHLATLIRAIKREHGQTFKEYFAQHAPSGKASLRRAQLQLAMGSDKSPPSPAMQIWLGKQMLGQGDRHQDLDDIDMPVTLPVKRIGAPHKYPRALEDRRALMSAVIECGRQGFSECEIAEAIDVSRVTMKGWANPNHQSHVPEFAEALDRAKHASQAWWERQARKGGIGTEPGMINAQVWKHVTACRFRADYAERPVAYAPGQAGAGARVKINYIMAAPTQLHSTPQREHITIDANPIDADT
jgi:hypothetical protein